MEYLCAMRVKNEAAHIEEVIMRALPLCHSIFVFDDHSTDDTPNICRSFGEALVWFPSPFEGLDEARDKNYLLQQIIAADVDWVLWIDGDEVLERTGPEKLRLAAENAQGVAAFALPVMYLWNDPHHIRVDGIYGISCRPSFFQLRGQPVRQLAFHSTEHGGNFHCGNVPMGLIGTVARVEARLKHYGYMVPQYREAKYRWYTESDPNSAKEGYYDHLIEIPGARYAPGPPRIVPWVE
jgi:glycosyltransferase involved in cell wall biosynthesis